MTFEWDGFLIISSLLAPLMYTIFVLKYIPSFSSPILSVPLAFEVLFFHLQLSLPGVEANTMNG